MNSSEASCIGWGRRMLLKGGSLIFVLLLFTHLVDAQESVVEALVDAGFENVGRAVLADGSEEKIIFETSAFVVNTDGIQEAIEILKSFPIEQKWRRLVVLQNGIPQISLLFENELTYEGEIVQRWVNTSYRVGSIEGIELENRSSYRKVDIVIYPQVGLRNIWFHRIYDVLLNLSPAVEMNLWKGSRLTMQMLIPFYTNYYETMLHQIRPGYVTLEQNWRVENIFLKGTVGLFNENRWGFDFQIKRPFVTGALDHFTLFAQMGLTGSSFFDTAGWWLYGIPKYFTGKIGAMYYNKRYDAQVSLQAERFLAGDYGLKLEADRHFRSTTIGFYAMIQNQGAFDAGFSFAIALPPYKKKREPVRVMAARYFTFEYQVAGWFYAGHSYKPTPGQNKAKDNFHPFHIESKLYNF